jgi:hypothetical protein
MPSLSEILASLARDLATEVLALARSSSVEDILAGHAPAKPAPGPPSGPSTKTDVSALPTHVKRMGPEMIESAANLITSYVKSHQGANAERIRKELGIPQNKWMRPLALALAKKGLTKKGQKRATIYFVK